MVTVVESQIARMSIHGAGITDPDQPVNMVSILAQQHGKSAAVIAVENQSVFVQGLPVLLIAIQKNPSRKWIEGNVRKIAIVVAGFDKQIITAMKQRGDAARGKQLRLGLPVDKEALHGLQGLQTQPGDDQQAGAGQQ